ncbi:pyruvate:ferredoxin (flavodoxin) oxidoreductase, partial [Sulfuricurvum sp. UBA5598]
MNSTTDTIDANEAVARIAYKLSEVIAIYPITPSSPMGELSDAYHARHEKNIFGTVPDVMEMQSEGGASGTVHGALQSGALTTTFTASQGLLLMIPNMYKIAGELTPAVFHVAARSIAAQALSIFADHSDVMAVRQTGFGMLCSNSVQEAHDFALIAQAATLESRIPFVHFFDGFRTSHEINKITLLNDDTLKAMIDGQLLKAHRSRALTPDNPFIRGTAQNPDVYFQGRESVNRYYDAAAGIVESAMKRFESLTGRGYRLFDYVGAPDAERLIVLMGSGAECAHESVEYLVSQGEKVGVLKVRLYRPFSLSHFVAALPPTIRSVAVLDRTKEPGSFGEPLYLDVMSALGEASMNGSLGFAMPRVIGGRYGLSSKEFTPAMLKAVFDELAKPAPKNRFTIGIIDDLTHTSLEWDETFTLPSEGTFEAIFYGLGSDGTVGANKNSIKIIGTETPSYAQGYFVYDSKKSGSMTISHLRFGPREIRKTYLIQKADFIACHQSVFMEKFDILSHAKEGAVFLLNSPFGADELYRRLPRRVQEQLTLKKIRMFAIDGYRVARENEMGNRINTVMQTCFFAISGVLPREEAIKKIKESIHKSYGKKGEAIVRKNYAAVDATLANLFEVPLTGADSSIAMEPLLKGSFDSFVADVTARLVAGEGDRVPVSMIPEDGTWPSGTTQYEKRNIALEVPFWDPQSCIQCNKCVLVCPHAVIRTGIVDEPALAEAPEGFASVQAKGKEFGDTERFVLQVSVEDCTGCALCVEMCPAKNKSQANLKAINMVPQYPLRDSGSRQWAFFTSLSLIDRSRLEQSKVKESQFLEPLFEFSGACPGCGETPYIKLASQLFGDRMIIA